MSSGDHRPARIWLPPGAPADLVAAVAAGGGELASAEDANALVLYGLGHPSAAQAPAVRALLSDAIEWVQLPAAGVEAFFEHGLLDGARVWTSAAGAYAATVAEHIVALLLASARRLPECARSSTWRKPELEGVPLAGSTVGIVGAGAIGHETIRRLEPFGVRVIALTRSGGAVPGAERALAPDGLDELLAESDYVVLCPPLTADTQGMIGARELALIGPRGVLVNVGRGALVDTAALVAALRDGGLGGAFLDVTVPEPLPDGHPLWSAPRVLITPHTANPRAALEAALVRRVEQNVARFRAGEPLLGVIDVVAGY